MLLHSSAALTVLLTFSGDQGRSKSHSESISLEAIETYIVEADAEVSNSTPPATSVAQQAMSAADDSKAEPEQDHKLPPEPNEAAAVDQSQWPKLALQTAPDIPPIEPNREAPPIAPDVLDAVPTEAAKPETPKLEDDKAAVRPVEERKEPVRQETQRPEREAVKEAARKPRQEKNKARDEQSKAPSVASRGPGKNSGGRTTASQGDMVSYRALVQARVASRRPAANGHRGTAVVSFGVSSGGSVTFATLSGSSGSSELDRAALAAVRSAGPFPPTPNHAPLSFSFPFYFQ